MKDMKTPAAICIKKRLISRLFVIVIISILGLTSSCIKIFKHGGKPDKNDAATLEIPQEVYIYDEYLEKSPQINVLLLKDVKEFNLTISSPFEIFALSSPFNPGYSNTPNEPNQSKAQITGDRKSLRKSLKKYNKLLKSRVTLTNSHILIGNNKFKRGTIVLVVKNGGTIEVNNNSYRGAIKIIPQVNGKFLVIEGTDVENFLLGVIGSEMPASWAKNTLFAQTVAARTFVLYKKKKRNTEMYHISKLDLAYKGILNENYKTREMVNKSKGIIMVYNWQIFPGYFHSTCGGHTEDVYHTFKEKSIPPLAGVSCGYCKSSKYYRWQTDVNKEELGRKLHRFYKTATPFSSLRPADLGPGGHAATIEIRSSSKTKRIDANTFRLLIGPNKLFSTAFTVKNNGKNLRLSGKGWGHGVGLCQYGSQGMSKSGFKWYEILKHYYPKIDLVKIY
ncbi:MAG: SpoIID/LytB domain-containing protein [Candidatus Anammoxibacter sp.]